MLYYPYIALQKAIEVMCVVPKRCNDMMNVGRLQGFEVRPLRALHACGKLPNLTRHLIDTAGTNISYQPLGVGVLSFLQMF